MDLQERAVGEAIIVDIPSHAGRDTGVPAALLTRVPDLLASGYKTILVNVAHVTYMDSLMLGALVQGYVSSANRGSTLKLVDPSTRVREMLAVTKLDTVFEMPEAEAAPQSWPRDVKG